MTGSDKPQLKARVEDLASSMSPEQEAAIRILANELHRVNEAVMNCVQNGLSVELQRVKRVHSEEGYWGDMIVPIIVKQKG
jgi:NADH:ubiquinone oxidoreductase subunit D